MIFLCKDGSFKLKMSDQKAIRWFEKHKSEVVAVLIEMETRLHSDTYAIVKAEHFNSNFIPFKVRVTFCAGDDNTPIDETNTITRLFNVDNPRALYSLTAMLYQMECCRKIKEYFDMSFSIDVLKIEIVVNSTLFTWSIDDTKVSMRKFLSHHMMVLDTDDFLDASLPLHMRAEKGHYRASLTREAFNSTLRDIYHFNPEQLQYYYTARKAFIYMRGDIWTLDVSTPSQVLENHYGDGAGDDFFTPSMLEQINMFRRGLYEDWVKLAHQSILVGRCISDTGLVYITPYEIASLYDDISLFQINPIFSDINGKISNGRYGDFVANDPLDVMLLAIYIPQLLDISRYLWGGNPVKIDMMLIMNRDQYKMSEMEIVTGGQDDESGIDCDLFGHLANVLLNEPARPIVNSDENGFELTLL